MNKNCFNELYYLLIIYMHTPKINILVYINKLFMELTLVQFILIKIIIIVQYFKCFFYYTLVSIKKSSYYLTEG